MNKDKKCKQCCQSVAAGAIILNADDTCQFCLYDSKIRVRPGQAEPVRLGQAQQRGDPADPAGRRPHQASVITELQTPNALRAFAGLVQNNIQGAGMSDLNERLGKLEGLVETLEAGFNTEYKILHDDQKKLMDTLETQLGTIRDLHDIVKTQSSSIAGLQRRVMIWEGSPPLPEKKATSKMLLKRFLAVQRICEASIELDTNSKVAPLPTDRRWLAQSVLNILKGNVDE